MFGIRWHVNALSSWPSFVQGGQPISFSVVENTAACSDGQQPTVILGQLRRTGHITQTRHLLSLAPLSFWVSLKIRQTSTNQKPAHFAGIAPRDPRAREGKRPQNNVFVHDRRTVWLMLESQNRDARRPEWQYLNSSVVC